MRAIPSALTQPMRSRKGSCTKLCSAKANSASWYSPTPSPMECWSQWMTIHGCSVGRLFRQWNSPRGNNLIPPFELWKPAVSFSSETSILWRNTIFRKFGICSASLGPPCMSQNPSLPLFLLKPSLCFSMSGGTKRHLVQLHIFFNPLFLCLCVVF